MKIRWRVAVAYVALPVAVALEWTGRWGWKGGFWLMRKTANWYNRLVEWAEAGK